jgi:hypothetical protein
MAELDDCTQLWQNLMTPSDEIDGSIELLPSMEMLALGMLPDLKSNLKRFVDFSISKWNVDKKWPDRNLVIQGVTYGNEATKLNPNPTLLDHEIVEASNRGDKGRVGTGFGGGNKIATQVGGGKVTINLDDADSFFSSNIYGTLIASAICVEWLCSPMSGDIVTYIKKDDTKPSRWECTDWSNNSIKEIKPWKMKISWLGMKKNIDMGWLQDLLTLSSDQPGDAKSHISNIVWSGKLERADGETIDKLYPSSLFVGRGLLQSIERWKTDSPNVLNDERRNEMVESFKKFVTIILGDGKGEERMQQWQNRYSLDYQIGGRGDKTASDAASALMNLLTKTPRVAEKLVTVWYNETKFTFADTSNNKLGAGSVVENPPDPRKNLESSETIDKLYGNFSNDGLVYKLLYLIQEEKEEEMEGVFSIFDGKDRKPNDDGQPLFGDDAPRREPNAKGQIIDELGPEDPPSPHAYQPKDADLVEYLKSLIGVNEEKKMDGKQNVLRAIYNTGIYMIVNLPSHGHTVLVLFKNNKIYTAGAGLWGTDNKKLLCFSPDDTMFVKTSHGLPSTRFQEGDKKIHEPNIITKVGFINHKLFANLTTFAELSDFVLDKFTLESIKYNYNRTNLYMDDPPTLSCSSWAWLMVEGDVNSGIRKPISLNNPHSRRGPFYGISTTLVKPEGVSITAPALESFVTRLSRVFLDRTMGGGRKNTRRKRRRKRKRTKRSKPNKKKRTKKHRKKRKYTKSRR